MKITGSRLGILATLTGLAMAGGAAAQDLNFFTIGTGGTGATYYPLGGVIANAVSNPPGSRPCDEGGSCGVPGLIAVAQSSRGSVNNVNGINSGLFGSGFSQSDVAYWAYTGTGVFDGEGCRGALMQHSHSLRAACRVTTSGKRRGPDRGTSRTRQRP